MKKILVFAVACMFMSAICWGDNNKKNEGAFGLGKMIQTYCGAVKELEVSYVDTLNYEKLLKTSLGAMFKALDPYTEFIPATDNTDYLKRLKSGEYGGVGSVITLMDSLPYFSEVYQGMPAAKAGIKNGDRILEIDGVNCDKKKIADVSEMLRGKQGTVINIKVKREGVQKPISFSFERELIAMPSIVYWNEVAPGIGYIRINDFVDRTSFEFKKALVELVEKSAIQSLIIDLRSNGGGLVDQAVDVASLFVPKGTKLVEMKGLHDEKSREYKTQSAPLYEDMKLLFLVNDNTASSSEILSGALQDIDRAVVMGEQTYGKGLVQNIAELPYNNFMKLTVAKYYLPSGRCVQRKDSADRKTFWTKNRREVEDGCGVTPDTLIVDSATINIADYLYVKNIYFKFATQYWSKNVAPADQKDFRVTDEIFTEFCKFVQDEKFTYNLESEKYLNSLKEMISQEGYGELTADIFKQMTAAIQPNVERDMQMFKDEIIRNLEQEMAKSPWYQWGEYDVFMKYDNWTKEAVKLIQNEKEFDKILK